MRMRTSLRRGYDSTLRVTVPDSMSLTPLITFTEREMTHVAAGPIPGDGAGAGRLPPRRPAAAQRDGERGAGRGRRPSGDFRRRWRAGPVLPIRAERRVDDRAGR